MNEFKNSTGDQNHHKDENINDNEKNISEKFYTLNKQFMMYLQYCYDANKNADFTPVLNDYIGYSNTIHNRETSINIPFSDSVKNELSISENIVPKTFNAQNFPSLIPVFEKGSLEAIQNYNPTTNQSHIVQPFQAPKSIDFINKTSFISNPIPVSSPFGLNFPPINCNTVDTNTSYVFPQNVTHPIAYTNFGMPKMSIADASNAQTQNFSSHFSSHLNTQTPHQQPPGIVVPPFLSHEISTASALPSNPFLSRLPMSSSTGTQFFGSAQPQTLSKPSTPSIFGFTNTEETEEGDEDHADSQPSDMGYEPSAICSIRAKLFYLKNGKYCEMGVGIFNIKAIESDPQHLQLIFRLESCRSGSVLMNIKIVKKPTNVTIQKDTNLIITTVPNPPIQQVTGDESFSDKVVAISYLVKTKTMSDMKNILDAINLDF